MNWHEQLQHAEARRAALEEQLRQAQTQQQTVEIELARTQLEAVKALETAIRMQIDWDKQSQQVAERGSEPTAAELEAGRQSEKFQQELQGRQLDLAKDGMETVAKAAVASEMKDVSYTEVQLAPFTAMTTPPQFDHPVVTMPGAAEANPLMGVVAGVHLMQATSEVVEQQFVQPLAEGVTELAGHLVPPGQAEFARTQIEQQIAQDLEQGQHDERAEAAAELEAKQAAEREQLSQDLQKAEALQTEKLQDRPQLLDRFYEQAAEMKREMELRHAQEQEALQRELEARQAAEREAVSQQLQQIEQQHFR